MLSITMWEALMVTACQPAPTLFGVLWAGPGICRQSGG